MQINKSFLLTILLFLFLIIPGWAQTTTPEPSAFTSTYYDIVALSLIGIILLVIFGFFYFGMGEGKPPKEGHISIWKRVKDYMVAATPVEKEDDIMLDHDYDGIKELDNKIPPWFSYLFYATIIFGVYYLVDYHVLGTGKLQIAEYEEEMQIAAAQRAELEKSGLFLNEQNVTLLKDASVLSEGKEIFKTNCVACHGPDGGGSVGPNLTDKYWIHGGGIVNVFKTIKYGVPQKGMVSWQQNLNPKQMQAVASYVISLEGTNPPNAKPPQGQIYEAPADSSSSDTKNM